MRLQNKTITIRDWEIKDFDTYRKWNEGDHVWMDFNGPYYPRKTSAEIENQIKIYQEKIQTQRWKSPRTRLVIADLATDELIGTVNWYWESEVTNWKCIGIAIYDDRQWGKNIGYHALKLWIDYLFQEDETLVRLDLRTWSGNKGMMRLAEKLGFLQEACFRKARIVKGVYYDSIGMGILREEWYERKTN